ncbi:MAG: NAD/NADP octopine/nopaline dehydrogenase family protein [Spirochaetales bacterium]|nr:NAD/NADP octopine/nopaline dehydrogenase family protein [Spirochaetales bacterium]
MKTGHIKTTKWTVIGGGNGGQSAAGHLALMGFRVSLFDIFQETIADIKAQGGINIQGILQGFGPLETVTTDLSEVVPEADVIMIVAPATAHAEIARNCAHLLRDGQIVFLHPGSTGGALEFHHILRSSGCKADVLLAESNSLLYACRSSYPGEVKLFAIKKELMVSSLPAVAVDQVLDILNVAFPQMYGGKNVLETSLGNPNAMMHPAPTLLNASMIESGRDWLYYWEGITPSIGAFVEAMDEERLAVGRAYGVTLTPILQWYKDAYKADGYSLMEAVKNNPAYAEVKGQNTLYTRYLLEDIPMGLVPMVALAQLAGFEPERMKTVIKLGELLLQQDLTCCGRSLQNLGLSDLTVEKLQQFVQTTQ